MAGRNAPAFKVRIPPDLDAWIEQQAAQNLRSKTAEIEFRLRQAQQLAENKPSALAGGATAAGEASQA